MIVLNRSWPAVSHICSLTLLPSNSIVRILKSMPMVVMKDGVNESSLNRRRQHDFPTPESPISSSLICFGVRCKHRAHETGRPFSWEACTTYEKIVVPSASHDDLCKERRVCRRSDFKDSSDRPRRGSLSSHLLCCLLSYSMKPDREIQGSRRYSQIVAY